jgi:hypothetical protein
MHKAPALRRVLTVWSIAAALVAIVLMGDPVRQVMELPLVSDVPVMATVGVALDLPPELRTKNWGGGSCVHASNVNLLKWMELWSLADWWRKTYSGGEYDTRLVARLEQAGLRYAYVHGGVDNNANGRDDGEEFLEWCARTRRGAGIFYKPQHSINLVGLDEQYAYLLDNNATDYPERIGHYERVPRAEFFRKWRGFGGFAWTLVYDPTPPQPFVER